MCLRVVCRWYKQKYRFARDGFLLVWALYCFSLLYIVMRHVVKHDGVIKLSDATVCIQERQAHDSPCVSLEGIYTRVIASVHLYRSSVFPILFMAWILALYTTGATIVSITGDWIGIVDRRRRRPPPPPPPPAVRVGLTVQCLECRQRQPAATIAPCGCVCYCTRCAMRAYLDKQQCVACRRVIRDVATPGMGRFKVVFNE